MKIVLSRKGFDSGSGGAASPILHGDEPVSLPIPDARSPYPYSAIGDGLLGDLARDLSRGSVRPDFRAHLDPDLDASDLARPDGWRGAFGQTGAAASHLDSCGVGRGDLFLFFGWFRDAFHDGSRWRFAPRGRNVHAFFGWLQVGEIVRLDAGVRDEWARFPWLRDHPHVVGRGPEPGNRVYVASERLTLPGTGDCGLPGWGRIASLSPQSILTAPCASSRSLWRLPSFLSPDERGFLSYHGSRERWAADGDGVLVRSVARGQEFVIDCAARPQASDWVLSVLGLRPSEARRSSAA